MNNTEIAKKIYCVHGQGVIIDEIPCTKLVLKVSLWRYVNLWKRTAFINRRNVVLLNNNARFNSARITQEKVFVFRLICSIPSTIFSRHSTKWFSSLSFSTKWPEFQKVSKENQVKNVLSSKPAEFNSWGINNYPNKWQEVIKKWRNLYWLKLIHC